MADKYVVYFIMTVLFFFNVNSYNIAEVDKKYNSKTYLEDPIVKKYCANKDVVCRSNDSAICAIRYVNGSSVYKDFRNHCYLFFSNICGNHGEDFLTLTDGSCEHYLTLRRNEVEIEETTVPEETTKPEETTQTDETTEPEETTRPEETTEPEVTTNPEETANPEETTKPEETTQTEETTEGEETTMREETTEPEVTTNPEETANQEETAEPEETTQTDEATEPEEATRPEETTKPEENHDSVQNENNSTETATNIDNTVLRNQVATETTDLEENNENVETENNTETIPNTDNPILRNQVTTAAPISNAHTENNETFDGRPCPYSCPKIYKPVCLNVNRGYGKYFKMLFFVNHCTSALYYCRHPEEFIQPPGEEYAEDPGAYVLSSPLDWSFCGAYKFLQFARFAESASSMGHYGWLLGDHRYSHITQANERFTNV